MKNKKLNLNKTTVVNLNDEEMKNLLGGVSSSVPDDYSACPTCFNTYSITDNISVNLCA